jgi:hypothetical protein
MGYATEEQAAALLRAFDERDELDRERMPDTMDALAVICRAKERLRKLGWREGIYCPKDGRAFDVVQFGSSGIFEGFYSGEWPSGHIIAADCAMRPEGVMWREQTDANATEARQRDRCSEATAEFIERLGRSFGA